MDENVSGGKRVSVGIGDCFAGFGVLCVCIGNDAETGFDSGVGIGRHLRSSLGIVQVVGKLRATEIIGNGYE